MNGNANSLRRYWLLSRKPNSFDQARDSSSALKTRGKSFREPQLSIPAMASPLTLVFASSSRNCSDFPTRSELLRSLDHRVQCIRSTACHTASFLAIASKPSKIQSNETFQESKNNDFSTSAQFDGERLALLPAHPRQPLPDPLKRPKDVV